MQPRGKLQLWHNAKGFLAAFLILWILGSSLAAASPVLHRLVHDDAGQDSHQCAITLLEQQQLVTSDSSTVVVPGFAQCRNVGQQPHLDFVSSVDSRNFPSRAPPLQG